MFPSEAFTSPAAIATSLESPSAPRILTDTTDPATTTGPHALPKYSEFAFFGASGLHIWRCMDVPWPCEFYEEHYIDNEANLPIDCEALPTKYCSSKFEKAFPGALNFAVKGHTIQGVTERIETLPSIRELAKSTTPGKKVSFIVIQAGYNNLWSSPHIHTFIHLYHDLLVAANTKFPHALILLMQINPVNDKWDDRRVEVNKLINATYSNNASFPFVKTCNIDRFWNLPDGAFDTSVFWDGVHMHPSGYVYYEAGLKDALKTLYNIE